MPKWAGEGRDWVQDVNDAPTQEGRGEFCPLKYNKTAYETYAEKAKTQG